jgi:RHS repeat-associated protein
VGASSHPLEHDDVNNNALYYELDLAGNVRRLMGPGGVDEGGYRYTAFGETYLTDADFTPPTGAAALPLRWKGAWLMYSANPGTANEVDLYDMRARWWCPQAGVFVQVDDFDHQDGSSTLWAWPGQNSLRWSDPSGHFATVTTCGNNVNVVIPIHFGGNAASAKNIQKIKHQIEQMWTGQFGKYNVQTTVRVVAAEPNTMSPQSPDLINQINLSYFSSNAENNVSGYGWGGDWDPSSDSSTVFAHEASHLLMLSDTNGPNANVNDITNNNSPSTGPVAGPNAQPSESQIGQIIKNNPTSTVEW